MTSLNRALAVLGCLMTLATTTMAASPKSLVIALDGARSDGIITARTPYLDSLIDGSFDPDRSHGAYTYASQTIQDAPTLSSSNHVSIMTGVGGTKHGVTSNTTEAMGAVDYAAYPHYLMTLEKTEPRLNTAFVITWGADLPVVSGADYIKKASDQQNVDRVVAILDQTFADAIGNDGTSWSHGTDPDAIFLFLGDIDRMGHRFGFASDIPNYISAIETTDTRIGAILDAIKRRKTFASEEWQIIVTSDHGGLGTGHGGMNPHSETIPFIVNSSQVKQGLLAGRSLNYDTPPTAIAHMLGSAAIPSHHDGVAQGEHVLSAAPTDITEALVVYLPFDADTRDVSGRDNHASLGARSDHDPKLVPAGGVRGGYIAFENFGGGLTGSSYLTLGNPADLDFGSATNYTFATWIRTREPQPGDSLIIANKNWGSGLKTGCALLANEGDGADFGFNLADGRLRRDLESIDFGFDAWWFVAASVDRAGNAVLFAISPKGVWHVLSDFSDDLGNLDSALPWNIGQDGTGSYAHNLVADLDELAIWRRALTLDEIRQLHAGALNPSSIPSTRNNQTSPICPITSLP